MRRIVLLLLVFCISRSSWAVVFPVGGEKDYSGFRITLELGGSWHQGDKWYRGHLGEDYVCISGGTLGKPVRTIAFGQVVFSGDGGKGWGPVVVIKHQIDGRTLYSLYGHLQNIRIKKNQSVSEGESIGEIGRVSPWIPHLHFEIKTQEAVDREGLIGPGYSGKDGFTPGRLRPSEFIKGYREETPLPDNKFRVISVYPVGILQASGGELPITLEFSQPVDEKTVWSNLMVCPDPILSVNPTVGFSPDKRKLTILPTTSLSTNFPYTILCRFGLRSQSGQPLEGVTEEEPLKFPFCLKNDETNLRNKILIKGVKSGKEGLFVLNPANLKIEKLPLTFFDADIAGVSGNGEILFSWPRLGIVLLSFGTLKTMGLGDHPSFTNTGDVVFYTQPAESLCVIWLFNKKANKVEKIYEFRQPDSSCPLAGPCLWGNQLFLGASAPNTRASLVQRLYQIDLNSFRIKTLIGAEEHLIPESFKDENGIFREKEPSEIGRWEITDLNISPSGAQLVFIKGTRYAVPEVGADRYDLYLPDVFLLNLKSGQLSLLTKFYQKSSLSVRLGYYCLERPVFSPDERRIAFSAYTPYQGDALVYILDLATGRYAPVAEGIVCDWVR